MSSIVAGAMLFIRPVAAQGSGTVIGIDGTVLRFVPSSAQGVAVKLGDPVPEGTTIETGPGSKVKISFPENVLTLGESTRVTLARAHYTAGGGVFESIVRLVRGIARSQVSRKFGDRSFCQIECWNTIAGVKGTDFTGEVVDGVSSAWFVFEGAVELRTTLGSTAFVKAGEMAEVKDPAIPVSVVPLPPSLAAQKRIECVAALRSGAAGAAPGAGARAENAPIPAAAGFGLSRNPQVSVVGNQPLNPSGLRVIGPPAPPAPPPKPPAPPAPHAPPKKPSFPDRLPF